MLLYFFHCTDKGKLLVKLKTIMSDLLNLTEKEMLLILYCTDKRGLFMKIRCYYTASRGIGKAISKTMLSYLRYRTEKGRQLVKPCCYMSCIVRTKGKLKPCLFVHTREDNHQNHVIIFTLSLLIREMLLLNHDVIFTIPFRQGQTIRKYMLLYVLHRAVKGSLNAAKSMHYKK